MRGNTDNLWEEKKKSRYQQRIINLALIKKKKNVGDLIAKSGDSGSLYPAQKKDVFISNGTHAYAPYL
jgi:hypothetical protein